MANKPKDCASVFSYYILSFYAICHGTATWTKFCFLLITGKINSSSILDCDHRISQQLNKLPWLFNHSIASLFQFLFPFFN